jgi:putative FmdB family regulatory protein
MPTYDYVCTACDHTFEAFQSIRAEPLRVCPECGGEVKRVIGPGAGFIFKGSGFYITDYTRSKDYKEKSKSESKGGEGAGSSDKPGDGGGAKKDPVKPDAPKAGAPS